MHPYQPQKIVVDSEVLQLLTEISYPLPDLPKKIIIVE